MMENEQKNDGVFFSEIELHCIARHLQIGDCMQIDENKHISPCFYCKYAFECMDIFEKNGQLPVVAYHQKISKAIGISLSLVEGEEHLSILEGSWIEKYPELLEEFSHLSIGEQADRLRDPDILQYRDGIGGK